MKSEKEILEVIKKLEKSFKEFAGDDEWTAERSGWFYALHWVLDKPMPKDYLKSSIPDDL